MQSKNKASALEAVTILNEAFESDPLSVSSLLQIRIPCNEELANHPQVVVREETELVGPPTYSLSAFGIITGVVERLTGYRIARQIGITEDTGREILVGFCLYEPEEAKVSSAG